MADKRLDQVTKVTDMAYVPVIMSDGSIGQIAKADLATVVAGNNPRTITSLRGNRLYKIGKASTWDYGSFIASVSDATGKGCSLIGISFRNMNTTQNVTYTRTGDSTLGIQVYKRIVGGTMEVFIYSSNNADSFSPICGFSSQSVELIGEITDLTDYTLVVSW